MGERGANTSAINGHNAEHEADIELRQSKHLNNWPFERRPTPRLR